MGRAAFTWRRDGDQLALAGSLDETARLDDLLAEAHGGVLVLDLGEIELVSSIGVRSWVGLQRRAAAANVRLELMRVAEPMIHQLNLVPATRAASNVTSFFASFTCEACGTETPLLLDVSSLGSPAKLPSPACPSCGDTLESTNPPQLYVTFLTGGSALG